MDAVKAGAEDLDAISRLIDYYSGEGLLTPRPRCYLESRLNEFYVCKLEFEIAGCAALHRVSDEAAEIRCFAVRKEHTGRGVGKALLGACLAEARSNGFERVFALTMEKEFFMKSGFARMSKRRIPLKTFQGPPELRPARFLKWAKLFAKMLAADSAYEMLL